MYNKNVTTCSNLVLLKNPENIDILKDAWVATSPGLLFNYASGVC